MKQSHQSNAYKVGNIITIALTRDEWRMLAEYLQLAQSRLLQTAEQSERAAVPPSVSLRDTLREHAGKCADYRERIRQAIRTGDR